MLVVGGGEDERHPMNHRDRDPLLDVIDAGLAEVVDSHEMVPGGLAPGPQIVVERLAGIDLQSEDLAVWH